MMKIHMKQNLVSYCASFLTIGEVMPLKPCVYIRFDRMGISKTKSAKYLYHN